MEAVQKFFEQWGPAILTFVLGLYSSRIIKAKNEKRIAELELKKKENREKVERVNFDVSDVDGVNKIAGPRD